MKIELASLKTFSTELPTECSEFIANLRKKDSIPEFIANLDKITEWYSALGKIEMGRWCHVLNDCNEILEMATQKTETGVIAIDLDDSMDHSVISILRFTSLLFENSFSRSVYSSIDHLLKLLDSRKMFIVVQTLRLLLVISKSSRYITQHAQHDEKQLLYMKLTANAECWNGKLYALKMSDCCSERLEDVDCSTFTFRTSSSLESFTVDVSLPYATSVSKLLDVLNNPNFQIEESEKILSLTKLRLAYNFNNINARLHCVMARLTSISILFYSRCLLNEWRINYLVNDETIEEICAILQLNNPNYNSLLDAVKTEAMKTLASIVFLEKPAKIQLVVDCLGLNSYHGFTSTLIRTCVDKLKKGAIEPNSEYSVAFVTALFSLVYHIAGFDYGGDSLISCSLIGSLLTVVKATVLPDSQISFVTRAVRIIDILTGIDVAEFNSHDGMNAIHEVNICKKHITAASAENKIVVCHQQQTALMKSLLNFLKRAISDTNYAAQVRRIMEGELPRSIIYIIENPEYFGSSLLHCAIHLTTSFIYQEPAQLTFLQDNGLTQAILKSFFDEKFLVSRDIVTGLPNVCSALCLNERGLKSFNEYKPLERIFRIIFSTKFITSLRKRKTEILEAATTLGTAFDELMRHQPTLRKDLLNAFVKILDDILAYGNLNSSKCAIAWSIGKTNSPDDEIIRRSESKTLNELTTEQSSAVFPSTSHSISDDSLPQNKKTKQQSVFQICYEQDGTLILPLGDYLGIIGALLEAILTNRTSNDNSLAMIECEIPQRLVKLLTLERPYPALFQSTYLNNLAIILRHLYTQSNKIDAFHVLALSMCDEITKYERCQSLSDMTKERAFLLNRINCLAFVVCNFLKFFASSLHDNRIFLLNYFATMETGHKFIKLIFEGYRKFNCDLIYINNRNTTELVIEENTSNSATQKPVDSDTNSNTNTTGPVEFKSLLPVASTNNLSSKIPLRRSDYGAFERLIQATILRVQKQIIEIIINLSKIFCNTVTRSRRSFDNLLLKNSYAVTEMIFDGVVHILEYDDVLFSQSSSSCVYVCSTLTMLKRLIFDDFQGHYLMLAFFYKSGCHNCFFNLSDYMIRNALKDKTGTFASWLFIVQRLVSINNVIVTKSFHELSRVKVDGFDTKKYLSLCHQDSLISLQKFFKAGVQNQCDKETLDQIINSIQFIVHGIVELYEMEKTEKKPELDILINEIDSNKVQQLVEMGFSQSDAVDALMVHTSVPEAAEALIILESNLNSDNILEAMSSTNVSTTTTTTTNNVLPVVNNLPVLSIEQTPIQSLTSNNASVSLNDVPSTSIALNEQMETDTSSVVELKDEQKQPQVESNEQTYISFSNNKNTFEGLKDMKTIGFNESIKFICENIVPDCITLLERESSLVFCVSELFSVFMNNSTALDWYKNTFVTKLIMDQEHVSNALRLNDQSKLEELTNTFSSTLHLFCLLWQGLENVKMCSLVDESFILNISDILFLLLETQNNLLSKLIPPILLCIDIYEKEKRINIRQKLFADNVEHIQWYYWVTNRYDSNSEWRDFTPICSSKLNRAFREGKSSVKIVVNEKKFVVDFIEMIQRQLDGLNTTNPHVIPVYAKAKLKENFNIEHFFESEWSLNTSSDTNRCERMINCLIKLLELPEKAVELSYSILSLLLRLLSMNNMAKKFIKVENIKTLISVKCDNRSLPLMSTLITLLLRICIEDNETLTNSFCTIIQSIDSNLPICLADLNSRNWFTKTKKHQKEWRLAMRLLFPIAARSPETFYKSMKKTCVYENGEISLIVKNENNQPKTIAQNISDDIKIILNTIVDQLLIDSTSKDTGRIMRSAILLKIISEFLRSYPFIALYFVEQECIGQIINSFMLNTDLPPEIYTSTRSLLVNLIVGPAAARASEIIINEIKRLLAEKLINLQNNTASATPDYKKVCIQIAMLCKIILLLRESAQANNTNKIRDMKQTYILTRYIHKKNLLVDFVKAIWHLPFNEVCVGDMINSILKMLECISRDLIAINSVRNANATAITASATAAAAIAAATAAAAAQVEAQSAVVTSIPSSLTLTSSTSTAPTTSSANLTVSFSQSSLNVGTSEIATTNSQDVQPPIILNSLNVDTEMSESHMSPVLQNVANLERDNEGSSSSSNESDETDIEESDSEGSDGEGGGINDEEENSDDDEVVTNHAGQNVINGIRRRHRNLQRELILDPQVRTSTPISEDEIDQPADIQIQNNERVLLDDVETDDTHRDDDDDEMNDDDEIMDEGEEDDVIEFEDALTDYLDVTYVADHNNELRSVHLQDINSAPELRVAPNNMTAFASANVDNTNSGFDDFDGRIVQDLHNNYADFEFLAASAGYVAGILTRFPSAGTNQSSSITVGIPIEEGTNRLRDSTLNSVENLFQHPLLRRPSQLNRFESSSHLASQPITSVHGGIQTFLNNMTGRSLISDVSGNSMLRQINDSAIQRMMLNRLSNNRRLQNNSGLHRRGALRRWHPIGNTGNGQIRAAHRFFSRLIDESLFPEINIYRSHNDGFREMTSERHLIEAVVPFFLDRCTDHVKILDAYSMHYISLIVIAYLEKELLVQKEPLKEETTKQIIDSVAINNRTSEENIVSETTEAPLTPTVQINTQPTSSSGIEIIREGSPHSNNDEDEQQSAAESVDSSELSNRLAVLVPTLGESEENTRDSIIERSPMEIDNNTIEQTLDENQSTDITINAATSNLSTVNETPAVEPSTVEDFREILGDIDVPEGVDPAFLAALPEDIRQEVIRDHLRQQRAQRINQAQTRQVQTSETNESENTIPVQPSTVPVDEVLDQEFLAALPPELQEEVLAQHEQRIAQRNRQNAEVTNNEGASASDNQAAVDIDAIFESLPPGLRAQVLADADDSVLQILPPNLLAEANRLRANLEQQQVFRFARMIDRHSRPTNSTRTIHQNHSTTVSSLNIEEKGVQIFDKESIVTILLFYFMDPEKFCLVRLQKLLKPLCLHSGTCDFIIWGLLSILNILNKISEDETSILSKGWIDYFKTQTALNHPERTLIFTVKDGVKVHPLFRSQLCGRVLDTLIFLARNFPQHFLPIKIRSVPITSKRSDIVPDLNAFWDVVKNINNKNLAEEVKSNVKMLSQLRDIVPPSLEQTPMAFILEFSNTDIIVNHSNLMDKSMKILQIIAQSVPSDSQAKINDVSIKWLSINLESLANIILHACYDEGLKDGRMFFIEILRILPSQRSTIFSMLYKIVKEQGKLLERDINNLLIELEDVKKSKIFDSKKSKIDTDDQKLIPGTKEFTASLIFCTGELHLNTLRNFTKRNSQPKKFLKSLETISYLRNQLKVAEKRKRSSPSTVTTTTTSNTVNVANTPLMEGETSTNILTDANMPSASNKVEESETDKIITEKTEEKDLEDMLEHLSPLWNSLSNCLEEMSLMLDPHAVLSLQHAAEAFFLAHAFMFSQKDIVLDLQSASNSNTESNLLASSSSISFHSTQHVRADLNKYTQKMFKFAEKHRTVLNQILRGNTNNLMEDSAFAILTYFPKLLDFDVKRKYFYKEIRKLDDRARHEDIPVRIRRNHLFSDSFRELFRLKNSDWKSRFYIIFEGEEGQDAGGLLREWYSIITREVFNPNYALFITAPGDRVTYMINKSSYINPEHLDYFKFVGRIIAKAIYDNKQLDCYFTRAFYKHILNVPIRYQDIESEDPSFFSSLEFLLKNPIEEMGTELTFSVEVEEFGVRSLRQLKDDGQKIIVNDTNKDEYVQLVCQMKMTGSIRKQLDAFLEGFYQIIPKKLISIFNEQELELLISGLPEIDIDDLCNNTEYKSYNRSSPQIQWFWRALRSFEQEDLAKFLQFVTGTSKVPLQGFAHLEGMNGLQKFTIHMDSRSNDRLPSAHTCFNQLDLPKYETYEQLRKMLLLAIRECSEGFAFA